MKTQNAYLVAMAFNDPLYATLLWREKIKKSEDLEHDRQNRFICGSLVVLNNFCNSHSVKSYRTFPRDIFFWQQYILLFFLEKLFIHSLIQLFIWYCTSFLGVTCFDSKFLCNPNFVRTQLIVTIHNIL